jgi:hypothetical protein
VVKVATVIPKDKCKLEYRSMDIENNKLYYIINSKETGSVFELYYIDLNKLDKGAVSLDKFNTEFLKENTWEIAAGTDIYSSQIYVKNDNIYYTSFNEKSLKKYNIKTDSIESILDNVDWYDYFVDKINNKIFYIHNSKLYLSDLEGKNPIELDNSLYTGSAFWTNAYYNNSPVFINPISIAVHDEGENIDDIYIFDYSSNSFKKVKDKLIERINKTLDNALLYEDSYNRNYEKFKLLGKQVSIENVNVYKLKTWREHVEYLRNWIINRINWLDKYWSK